MAGPLMPNHPPPHPSSLMAVEILELWKKRFQKSSFFLNGPALYIDTFRHFVFCEILCISNFGGQTLTRGSPVGWIRFSFKQNL